MSALAGWRVRPSRPDDLDALEALALAAGRGFTNLPHDRCALKNRLKRSAASFARAGDTPDNELYLLVLEETATGRLGGTGMLFSQLGVDWPFYSYRIGILAQASRELGRTIRTRVLHLVNDFDGASEVGGLFVLPELRAGGHGRLMARSRYLFMADHRPAFADRVIAELRGVLTADGRSPFWDGLAGRFFAMPFAEADRFNSLHGNQFIADLMPKYPVYEALLDEEARAVVGREHPEGTPARRLLEREGFRFAEAVDIFDGGPTMVAETDRLAAVAGKEETRASGRPPPADAPLALVSTGRFATWQAMACPARATEAGLDAPGFEPAQMLSHVTF